MKTPLKEMFDQKQIILLDGPMGTELSHRGFALDRPGWSARALLDAPELVTTIHRDYVTAGANVLTTNTFRTHAKNLSDWDCPLSAREMTQIAVNLAHEAAHDDTYIFGSIAPLGDCYQLNLEFDRSIYQPAHAEMVSHFTDLDIDAILVETQVSLQEASLIAQLCHDRNIPFCVSFVTKDGTTLFDGTPLSQIQSALLPYHPLAIGVNCLPVELSMKALKNLRPPETETPRFKSNPPYENVTTTSLPLMIYANAGWMDRDGLWKPSAGSTARGYRDAAKTWIDLNTKIIGGCCGTTPQHIHELRSLLEENV